MFSNKGTLSGQIFAHKRHSHKCENYKLNYLIYLFIYFVHYLSSEKILR